MSDDSIWRRPADGPPVARPASPPPAPALAYTGPPPTRPPSRSTGPAPVLRPLPPPRPLPKQDHDTIDAAEQQATIVSYGVGIAAGVVAVLLLLFIAIRGLSG